jgi:hypothetical protein
MDGLRIYISVSNPSGLFFVDITLHLRSITQSALEARADSSATVY